MFKLIYFSWEVSGTSWINFIFPFLERSILLMEDLLFWGGVELHLIFLQVSLL